MNIATSKSTDLMEISGGELIDLRNQPSALEAITRAEVDVQIATAKRYPRSMTGFLQEAQTMVAINADLAAQCTYTLPARAGGSSMPITGPSVRLAEICAVCWGNLRVVGRITDDDGKTITAQAVAIDLERNVGYQIEVRRGVVNKNGVRFNPDMLRTTCNAAIAVATRNATFKVVPRAFVNLIQEHAQAVARGDETPIPERTARALNWFASKGVPAERVYATLGIRGAADMTVDLLQTLNGYKTSINEGLTTPQEVFAPPSPPEPTSTVADPARTKAEALASKLGAKPKPEPPPDEPGSNG